MTINKRNISDKGEDVLVFGKTSITQKEKVWF